MSTDDGKREELACLDLVAVFVAALLTAAVLSWWIVKRVPGCLGEFP